MPKQLRVPHSMFHMRVGEDGPEHGVTSVYVWKAKSTADLFASKNVIVVSLPGAFTPTCSGYQVPAFETLYRKFQDKGIDEIYVMSVNDAYVMNAWKKHLECSALRFIPDGNGDFTRKMGYLIEKRDVGFGSRSWRYVMHVENMNILKIWEEPGFDDNVKDDPYEVTNPMEIIKEL